MKDPRGPLSTYTQGEASPIFLGQNIAKVIFLGPNKPETLFMTFFDTKYYTDISGFAGGNLSLE